jgi:hypothetical protein
MTWIGIWPEAFIDSRFGLLAVKMGWSDSDHAVGKMCRLWIELVSKEKSELSPEEIGIAWRTDPNVAVAALVDSGMAEMAADGKSVEFLMPPGGE